ncbi:MAG: hypothetical protein NZM43_13710 [Saprospiraceae bacterium]|nr:hypothetical protein [Saprospiraceae bacterium]MDW8485371.1 hypothetical protein [Saprospiraceae bacterium]
MTNAQITLQQCEKALQEGKLNSWETRFVQDILQRFGYDKKALRNLSRNQYITLCKIAEKA